MKKFAAVSLAALALAGTVNASWFGDDSDKWSHPECWYNPDCNPYDPWDPRYWAEEMDSFWNDDNDLYYGPYGPFGGFAGPYGRPMMPYGGMPYGAPYGAMPPYGRPMMPYGGAPVTPAPQAPAAGAPAPAAPYGMPQRPPMAAPYGQRPPMAAPRPAPRPAPQRRPQGSSK